MLTIRLVLRWISILNISRLGNLLLLKLSYYVSRIASTNLHRGKPFHVSFEPTTACNLACPECPSGLKSFTRPTGKINLNNHLQWLDQLKKYTCYITYYFQGEPFLHPQMIELIAAAHERNIYTATSTNAHFINDTTALQIVRSGLDQLIISVDGATQDVYEQYRVNGQLEKVWKATQALVAAKRELNSQTPVLIFQCLAVKPNEHEIPLIFQKAKEFGVDEVRIKSAQLYDFENGNPLMPDNEEYSRYTLSNNGKYKLKWEGGNHCWRMWSGSVITWDGKVVPCCFDKDAKYTLGSLSTESFNGIWRSQAYNDFRSAILKHRHQIDICNNCSEGSKVWH